MSKHLHELGQLIVACETYIIHGNQVLLHKRAADKKKFPGYWIGPGGHVDAGEDVLTTALREVKEETGVALNVGQVSLKVLALHHHLDRQEVWIEYLFRAELPEAATIRSSKEGESAWIDIDRAMQLDNVFPPSKFYFDHILQNKPGIMYTACTWRDAQLVEVQSQRVDQDT